MSTPQKAILLPVPRLARYATFSLAPGADPRASLRKLRNLVDGERTVAGFGESLVSALNRKIDGLRSFPQFATRGLDVPSTPAALWLWMRGDDRGELMHRSRHLGAELAPALQLDGVVDAFQHGGGRDLTGYEDGTENPKGKDARKAAIIGAADSRLAGSSFVAVQQWRHDFARFDAMSRKEQDLSVGRRRDTNEEIDNAPKSAHVKRTAQESFDPPAFMLRRSMPWMANMQAGLLFLAFGSSLYAFEAQMKRMAGREDGITDAIFTISKPVSGSYFWCPPMRGAQLDLRQLGL